MTNAYLVLFSSQGVETLAEETPHTRRFFERRSLVSGGRLACYWALLPTEDADEITRLTRRGDRAAAQRRLAETLLDAGPISPSDQESRWIERILSS